MQIVDLPASNQEALEALEQLEIEAKDRQEKINELNSEAAELEADVDELTSQIFDIEVDVKELENSQIKANGEMLLLRVKLGVIPCPGQIPLDEMA